MFLQPYFQRVVSFTFIFFVTTAQNRVHTVFGYVLLCYTNSQYDDTSVTLWGLANLSSPCDVWFGWLVSILTHLLGLPVSSTQPPQLELSCLSMRYTWSLCRSTDSSEHSMRIADIDSWSYRTVVGFVVTPTLFFYVCNFPYLASINLLKFLIVRFI